MSNGVAAHPRGGPSVVTVGVFDGVHVGHRALVRRCVEAAAGRARAVALAFEPHPASVLAPGREPVRLTDWPTRERLLRGAGADEVRALAPSSDLLSMSPEEFVRHVRDELNPVAWVEGPDFRFGKGRAGDLVMLERLGREHGFGVHIVEPREVVLGDHSIVPARSTLVRWLLANGRVRDAAAVLGRPHTISGEVVKGDQRGRTIGFPTANVAVRGGVMTPGDGVYAARARIGSGDVHAAAVNIGDRPTFNGVERRIEAHVIGVDLGRVGVPEYGWGIEIEFVSRLRDQVRFASLDDLKGQLTRDVRRAAEVVAREAGSEEAA